MWRHDDVMAWKGFLHHLPFVKGIQRSPESPSQRVSDADIWYFLWRKNNPGPVSIYRYCPTSIWIPIIQIWPSHDRLIFIMGMISQYTERPSLYLNGVRVPGDLKHHGVTVLCLAPIRSHLLATQDFHPDPLFHLQSAQLFKGQWVLKQIKSDMFVKKRIQNNNKETINALHYCPFVLGIHWLSHKKGQWCGKCVIVMTSSRLISSFKYIYIVQMSVRKPGFLAYLSFLTTHEGEMFQH